MTARATEIALFTRRRHPTAPRSEVAPSMIMASSVTSPSDPGDPPNPTVPSHWRRSQAEHPASTASTAVRPCASVSNADAVALVHGHVLMASTDATLGAALTRPAQPSSTHPALHTTSFAHRLLRPLVTSTCLVLAFSTPQELINMQREHGTRAAAAAAAALSSDSAAPVAGSAAPAASNRTKGKFQF